MLPLCAACLASSIYMLFHSISGSQLIGCGTGSGCDSVMGSPWAYIAGRIPVSAAAAVTYVLLIICLLFLSDGKNEEDRQLDRIIWTMMLALGGAVVGAALWFSYLQIGVLHRFCKWCTMTHLLGCVCAGILVANAPVKLKKGSLTMVIGLLAAGVFSLVQVKTMPSVIYDDGVVAAALPDFEAGELPTLGAEDAEHEITLMFDFQCNHCRAVHKLLPEVIEKSGGTVRFRLCPVSLSTECNPYIPHGGIDRFAGSCTMAKLGLAVWYSFPQYYPEVESYLLGSGDNNLILKPEEAYSFVASLVGPAELENAIEDDRVTLTLNRSFELFGRTSSSSKSGIPRLICGQKWLVPETDSADGLLSVIESTLL